MVNSNFCFFSIPKNGKKVIWEITNKCNFKCKHCCSYSSNSGTNNIGFEFCKRIVEELKEAGVTEIYFSGGEPLILDYFLDLLDFCISRNISVSFSSNCSFITPKKAERLGKMKLKKVHASLDGHTKKINSVLRGKTFDSTVNGIKELVKNNVYVKIGHIVFRYSAPHLDEMVKFAIKLGVNEISFSWLMLVGRIKENIELLPKMLYEDYVNEIEKLRKKYSKYILIRSHRDKLSDKHMGVCPGGDKIFFINSEGKVSICSWVFKNNDNMISSKSLVNSSFKEIINSNSFEKIKKIERKSQGCPIYFDLCGVNKHEN